jgi:hypothetical protein
MRSGAFAIFDALGFRGIWKRPKSSAAPEQVLAKLEELRRTALTKRDALLAENQPFANENGLRLETQVLFLSDTIVVATSSKNLRDEPSLDADSACVVITCRLVSEIVAMAALTSPPLTYRGCVAFGDFELGEQFVVGPAVDAAADCMDLADGAFVWLLSRARQIVKDSMFKPLDFLGSWEVPIKGRSSYESSVVLPFSRCDLDRRLQIIRASEQSFDDERFDVQIKLENTLKVLQHHHSRLYDEERSKRHFGALSVKAESKPHGG